MSAVTFTTELIISSDTRYLSFLRQWVGAAIVVSGSAHVFSAVKAKMSLALIEAVDNAIYHGNRGKRHLPIVIRLLIRKNLMRMVIVDCGSGMKKRSRDLPTPLATHGRGMFLIDHFMTSVYSCVKNKRHLLTLTYKP